MTDAPLIFEFDAGWATIWFNRPDARNALSGEVVDLLLEHLARLRERSDIRGLTLRGKGGVFCAGGDIKGFKALSQGGQQDEADVAKSSEAAGILFATINEFPHPVIMLVDGAAMAGGFGIVCAGDIVIVTQDTKFALTETTLGIAPAQIAPFVVQRLGLSQARRLMLTAARFDGVEAGKIGLADYVVSDLEAAEAKERDIRADIMRCAPGANTITKEIVLKTRDLSGDAMRKFAAQGFARAMLSDEGVEGVSAFIEKRKPRWVTQAGDNHGKDK